MTCLLSVSQPEVSRQHNTVTAHFYAQYYVDFAENCGLHIKFAATACALMSDHDCLQNPSAATVLLGICSDQIISKQTLRMCM